MLTLKLTILVLVANAAPVLAALLLGRRGAWALDAGRRLRDGQPLFGSTKTYRGVLFSIAFTIPVAVWLGLQPGTGLAVAVSAMTGDLASSFIKRRLGLPSGTPVLGLDQIPEAVLPLFAVTAWLELSWWTWIVVPLAFTFVELLLSRLHRAWSHDLAS